MSDDSYDPTEHDPAEYDPIKRADKYEGKKVILSEHGSHIHFSVMCAAIQTAPEQALYRVEVYSAETVNDSGQRYRVCQWCNTQEIISRFVTWHIATALGITALEV